MAISDAKAAAQHALTKKAARGTGTGTSVPVVGFEEVSKVYDGGHVGLERVSMRIGRGEFVFLVGPTGCGKSTRTGLGMREPGRGGGVGSGAGRDPTKATQRRLPHRRRNIGV